MNKKQHKITIGSVVKIRLPGERPWIEVTQIKDEQCRGIILNKLLREYSEFEQAQFTNREFGQTSPLKHLHNYKKGDEVNFTLDEILDIYTGET